MSAVAVKKFGSVKRIEFIRGGKRYSHDFRKAGGAPLYQTPDGRHLIMRVTIKGNFIRE